jgi:1-deoxy-D-xylulose-5-phosphate synthase
MLSERGLFDKGLKIRSMILPDIFINQDTPENMYKMAGLDAQAIEQKAIDALQSNIVIPKIKNSINKIK